MDGGILSTIGKGCFRRIIEAVIAAKGDQWNSIPADTARSDAETILEAVVAELGVVPIVAALDRQGLKGKAYRYSIAPLVEEAQSRRVERKAMGEGAPS